MNYRRIFIQNSYTCPTNKILILSATISQTASQFIICFDKDNFLDFRMYASLAR